MWKKIIVAILVVTVTATTVMAAIEVQGNMAAKVAIATPTTAATQMTAPMNGAGNAGQGR